MLKKIKNFLFTWDVLWSFPLGFLLFSLFGKFGEWYFGEGFSQYDASFFQSGLYAAAIMVLFSGTAFIGIFFNFQGVHTYYTTKAKEDFNSLIPLQKIGITLFIYLTFIFIQLIIWSKLV